MRIIQLTAENVKRLVAVEITPEGNVVTISGKNGAGKSSLLDSIQWLIDGTKGIQSKPLRKGQTKGRIKASLGEGKEIELIVERKFSGDKSELHVTTEKGFTPPGGAQTILNALKAHLSFDPGEFARMDSKRQFDEFLRVFPIGVDLAQLDGLNRTDYAKRTEINREARAKRAQAAAVIVPIGVPAEPIDEDALIDQMQEAGASNARIETQKANRISMDASLDTARAEVLRCESSAERYRKLADEADEEAARYRSAAEELQRKIEALPAVPEPIDVSALRSELEAAKERNRQIETARNAATKKKELEDAAASAEAESETLTAQMEARDKQKSDALSAAKYPIEGLSVGDGVVMFNGVPFDQASASEQMKVSVAIAMAANPELRVILMRDGSLLDDDSLAQIEAMAAGAEPPYQVWIERVDSSGTVGFVIEDGSVKRGDHRGMQEPER